MEILKSVIERRSIRKYLDKPVEKEKIELCLEAARLSPSACNIQPYKFLVLEGEKKDNFANEVFRGIYKPCIFAAKAPVIIAIISTAKTFKGLIGNQIQDINFSLVDMGIAGEHLILQATALGLGTCWLGWFDKKKANKILNIKKSENVELLISLGYGAEAPRERKKKDRKDFSNFWS